MTPISQGGLVISLSLSLRLSTSFETDADQGGPFSAGTPRGPFATPRLREKPAFPGPPKPTGQKGIGEKSRGSQSPDS